jgi:putative heme transporter
MATKGAGPGSPAPSRVHNRAVETHAPLARAAAYAWRALLLSAAVLAALYVFQELTVLFLPIIIALFITTILMGPVKSLTGRGVPRMAAVWLVLLGSIAALVGLVTFLAPQVSEEFQALGPTVQEGWEEIQDWLITGPLDLTEGQLEDYTQQAVDAVGEQTDAIISSAVAGATLAVEVVVGLLLTFVLVFFFLKDGDKMCAWFVGLLRDEKRDTARALGARAWTAGGGYVRGTAFIAFVDAVGIGIGLLIIGVPLVLPLAILTFFGGFFPLVGATVAGMLAVLVALVDGGLTPALLTLAVVIGVQQLESNVLEPVVLSKAVKIHPVGVLAALTTGAIIGGLLGAFLAVPTVAVIVAMMNELRVRNIIGPGRPRREHEVGPHTPVAEAPGNDPGVPEDFRDDGKDQVEGKKVDLDESAPVGARSASGGD